jgi:hypothetical protein
MIKVVTQILQLLRGIFTRAGVDFERMLAIVTVKLTVDNRVDRSGRNKKTSNALWRQGVLLGISGAVFFVFGMVDSSFEIPLLLFHSYLLLMLMMSFMMEYSRLLFNRNDNHILQHLPVTSKTILVARLVTMLSYMFFLSGCMSVIPAIVIVFWQGLMSAGLFIISVFLNTLFTLLLANVIYLGVMRFISVEKFVRVMSYVQVILVAGVAMSYQLVGMVVRNFQVDMLHPETWVYFTPPFYFVALTTIVKQSSIPALILALSGIAGVVLLGFITVVYLAPYFSVKMGKIDEHALESKARKMGKERWLHGLARVFARTPLQISGFVLGWRLTRDNLRFRQGILPMIIYTIFLAFFFIYQGSRDGIGGAGYYMPLYMASMVAIGVQMHMSTTEKEDLLWVYRSKPLARPGALILGSYKALYVKYYLPVYVLLSVVFIVRSDWIILPDLLFILAMSTFVSYVYLWFSGMLFPFSKERGTMNSGRNILRIVILMFMLFVIGGLHALSMRLSWYGIWIAVAVAWIVVLLAEYFICRVSWKRVQSNY